MLKIKGEQMYDILIENGKTESFIKIVNGILQGFNVTNGI